jgi:putative hemolysin
MLEFTPRNSPFRVNPGPCVELKTTSANSLLILSLICVVSFLMASIKALIFRCSCSGVNPSCPIAIRTTPSRSLYSAPFTSSATAVLTFFTTVPIFALGINCLGPRILPNPALFILASESVWQMQRSNSICPSFIDSKTSSSPTKTAPAALATSACLESGGQITQIRRSVATRCGNCSRLRRTGPFFSDFNFRCNSYFTDVGDWPTSAARI